MPELSNYKSTSPNGKTEEGYTARMRRNILGTEKNIRNYKDEQLHAFDEQGNKLHMVQGKGAEVRVYEADKAKIGENAIITHNHPRALGKSGVMAIGNSFSGADLNLAITMNASEIRAVTPTYTFSFKRPKGGWNATPKQVVRAYNRELSKVRTQYQDYVTRGETKYGDKAWSERAKRASITTAHAVNKALAKRFGWDYTKKNR